MDEASLILFMVDVTTGIVEMDLLVAELLRKSRKKVLVLDLGEDFAAARGDDGAGGACGVQGVNGWNSSLHLV